PHVDVRLRPLKLLLRHRVKPSSGDACDLQNTRGEMPTYSRNSTVRDAGYGAHERNRTADLLLTMQMLYRLSYVGSGAARGKIGCEQGPHPACGPQAPRNAKALVNRAKNPVPTFSSRKKVAGSANRAIYGTAKPQST